MDLDTYLSANAIKGVDFAVLIGVSEASLTRIRRGEQNISRDLIRRIVEATDGQVTPGALVFHEDHAATDKPVAATPSRGNAGADFPAPVDAEPGA